MNICKLQLINILNRWITSLSNESQNYSIHDFRCDRSYLQPEVAITLIFGASQLHQCDATHGILNVLCRRVHYSYTMILLQLRSTLLKKALSTLTQHTWRLAKGICHESRAWFLVVVIHVRYFSIKEPVVSNSKWKRSFVEQCGLRTLRVIISAIILFAFTFLAGSSSLPS